MTNEQLQGLGYDEVLLVPAASSVLPHTVSLATQLDGFKLNIPLIANAQGTSSNGYAIPMALNGGLGVIAAEDAIEKEVTEIQAVKNHSVDQAQYPLALVDKQGRLKVAAEVWLTQDIDERISSLKEAGADGILLYLNQALTDDMVGEIQSLHSQYPELLWLVGVIENPQNAQGLYKAGVDGVIAGRSVDSNWPNNSHYPFLTVTMGIAEVAAQYDKAVIAGSGVHYSGDVVKAIAGGADAVMISDYLAGDETPDDAIFQIDGGLRAGMGYTGSKDVPALKSKAQFVQITDNGLRESHPHDVEITKQAPNYLEQERD